MFTGTRLMLRHSATQQWQCKNLPGVRRSGRSGAPTDMLPTLPSFVLGWVEAWPVLLFLPLHVQAANAGIKSAEYKDYAASQINYMLGDNPNSFSYVVGYGDSFPKQPHHKVPRSNQFQYSQGFKDLLLTSGSCLCFPTRPMHLGNLQ